MIDARDQVQSAGTRKSRRTASPVLQGRSKEKTVSQGKKLAISRVFSDLKVKPFDQLEWDRRVAEITDDGGKVIFKQENVEVPKSWSQLATKVVVSKYFYGEQNTSERETSVR
ncbi:MAG TPA: vitamin B12-dependent ribonucleotide reductase, partial [Candidatus Binatia bacterium]|nr:vitamin B12-dependent ribonucleotide reductase [Candidatus Binatia bacterium]